jgi:heptaprenyl diphosphate synthase
MMGSVEPIGRGRGRGIGTPVAVGDSGARHATETIAEVEDRTKAGLVRVERALARAVATADPFIHEAAGFLLAAGGKRFRPTCVLLAGHFGDPDEPKLVPAAVSIELTHLSTLYHDDVMDEAELRRGTRTANARYGNHVAILTGDYLFARASEITADLGTEATRVLARAIARLCQGQIRDVRGPLESEDPTEHYMRVLADKTGALIAAACRLGARLAGADPAVVEALTEYGERLGVAFQLGDDLLDIAGGTSGKEPGADLRQGVTTLPVLYLLREGGAAARPVRRVLDGATDDASVEAALEALRGSEAFAEARASANAEVDRARACLASLPAGAARDALELLAAQALERDR